MLFPIGCRMSNDDLSGPLADRLGSESAIAWFAAAIFVAAVSMLGLPDMQEPIGRIEADPFPAAKIIEFPSVP